MKCEAKEIAEAFNSHFVEIGPKLASSISQGTSNSNSDFSKYVNKAESTFNLMEITPDVILDIIKAMSPKNATGLDNVSCRFLKDAAPIICQPLAVIFNKSVETGIFPSGLKLAKVTPVFK